MQQPISTFLGIAAGLVLATDAHAADINVPGDQPTIQAGINAAVKGDEVVVAIGTYNENINFNGKAITVRSTDPTDAGVVLITIISGGGLAGSVVTCDSGEGPDSVLNGFVITGGTGTNVGNSNSGGGMFNFSSSPTVTNCSFIGNDVSGVGGGIYNDNVDAIPTVTNCTFSGNTAATGGGFFNGGGSPTLTNCWFTGNLAHSGGSQACP